MYNIYIYIIPSNDYSITINIHKGESVWEVLGFWSEMCPTNNFFNFENGIIIGKP